MIGFTLVCYLLTNIFKLGSSIDLNCGFYPQGDFYQSYSFNEDIYSCSLRFTLGKDDTNLDKIIVNHKINKTDEEVALVVFIDLAVPIKLPELLQRFTHLKFCAFYNSSILSLDCNWFGKKSETLKKIIMFENRIPTLKGGKFEHLKNLEKLEMQNNAIKDIQWNAFIGLQKLKRLDLVYNEVEYLPATVFNDLVSLKELFLGKNPIKALDADLFRNLVLLENLDVGHSLIGILPDGLFKNNLKLKDISFDNGNISRISSGIFSHLKQLNFVSLRDNACLSDTIEKFNLSIAYAEDLLVPCTCQRLEKENLDLKIRKIMNYFGMTGMIILVIFIFFIKHNHSKKDQPSSNGDRIQKVITDIIKQYISSTTIQGLNYVGNEALFWIDRVLWLSVLLVLTTAFIYYSLGTFFRWQERPVIIGFDEQPTSIFEIPFPAIHLCYEAKFDKRRFDVDKVNDAYLAGNFNASSIEKLEVASIMCNINLLHAENQNFNMRKILEENKVKHSTTWVWGTASDIDFGSSTLTEEGLCTSFNTINANLIFRTDIVDHKFIAQYQTNGKDPYLWSMREGYAQGVINNYPHRVFKNNKINGVSNFPKFMSEDFINIDTFCRRNPMSIKIALSHPAEIPHISENHMMMSFNQTVTLLISPKITKTTESLKSYNPLVRQCYFYGERQLKFYQIYTKANCEMECLTNLTLRYCGCAAFFMPRESGTPICGFISHHKCLELARKISSKELQVNSNCNLNSVNDHIKCSCLPLCNEIIYSAEVIQSDYEQTETLGYESNVHVAEIYAYFKENKFTTVKRSEVFGFIDFISNCGGLMGLFMGISVFSVFEILYYFGYLLIRRLFSRADRVYDIKR